MSITLRPYKPMDAVKITSWLKSEYLMASGVPTGIRIIL